MYGHFYHSKSLSQIRDLYINFITHDRDILSKIKNSLS